MSKNIPLGKDSIYSEKFRNYIRELAKAKKLQDTKVFTCNCEAQICRGKFIRKFEWQTHCQWEMLRTGKITNTLELTRGLKYWENQ